MREIVLDTETTGFKPEEGHRIVEIGCLELKNHIPTGEKFHVYVNPRRDMPEAAENIHGLSYEFLKDHPPFEDHAKAFLDFIGNDRLVIHNARFDMNFINAELTWCGHSRIPFKRALDTLSMARQKFPGAPASLDALCKRFKIDNSNRVFHGALLDSELLAEVYLELIGGKQPELLGNEAAQQLEQAVHNSLEEAKQRIFRQPRSFAVSLEDKQHHEALLEKLQNPLWKAI
jgi:DNA polymerase III, epsilon subunit, Proteobacterial